MTLHVQAVLQPERPELILAQRALEETLGLAPELQGSLPDDTAVDRVVLVHARSDRPWGRPVSDGVSRFSLPSHMSRTNIILYRYL